MRHIAATKARNSDHGSAVGRTHRAALLGLIVGLWILPLAGAAQGAGEPAMKPAIPKLPPLTVRLQVAPGRPVLIGTPITLTASTAGGPATIGSTETKYSFGYKLPGDQHFAGIRDFGTNPSVTWTPPKSGAYQFIVTVVKYAGGQQIASAANTLDQYKVNLLPADATLFITPTSGQPGAVSVTATLTGCCQDATTTKKFQFHERGGPAQRDHVIVTNGTTATWTPAPSPQSGTYRYTVGVVTTRASDNEPIAMLAEKRITDYRVPAATTGGTGGTPVLFGDYLHGKFTNTKCMDCHTFTNANSARRRAHFGRFGASADVTSNSTCSVCHNASTTCIGAPGCVADWRAAPSSMNWTGKSAKDTCLMIKTDSQFASANDMRNHLKADPLIVRALGRANISTTEWNSKVDAWVDGGMKCE